jgi:hypothetical protein
MTPTGRKTVLEAGATSRFAHGQIGPRRDIIGNDSAERDREPLQSEAMGHTAEGAKPGDVSTLKSSNKALLRFAPGLPPKVERWRRNDGDHRNALGTPGKERADNDHDD